MTPERIFVPAPLMGGKAWLLDRKGLFILEDGPGTIRTIACTHAGSGHIKVFDGIPDERGFFPGGDMQEPEGFNEQELLAIRENREDDLPDIWWKRQALTEYASRNGRVFHQANPIVMGSWMMDAGFHHGLTIEVTGSQEAVNPFATVVWAKFQQRVPRP